VSDEEEFEVSEMMKWFGVSWGAPMNEECPNVPPPVGERCVHCEEGIVAADSGVIYANGPVAHRNCFLRGVSGSLAHIMKQCSCYVPGSECGDPPNMTRRQAADEVAKFLGYSTEDLMCDFCAARGELTYDVKADKRFVGTFKSGNVLRDSGEWGACRECEQLIKARDWHGLVERCIAGTDALFPDLAFDLAQRNRMKEMIEGVFGVRL
jgi:hypothetical protein